MIDMIEDDRASVNELDKEVIESIRSEKLLTENLNDQLAEMDTRWDYFADSAANFIGSWWYITTFLGVLSLWLMLNIMPISEELIEDFPFNGLRLFLSCLITVQTSIILNSQRRGRVMNADELKMTTKLI